MIKELIIREDFKALCPPLTEAELEQLHCSLDGDGCRDPLVVWKGKNILVDGHNRYAYCIANNIDFDVREIRFVSDDNARNFIILNQLGRRNLAPEAAAVLRAKLYYGRKKEVGAPSGNTNNSTSQFRQNDGIDSTAEIVAKETGVSARTVERDAAFAAAAEKLGITQDVIAGKMNRKRARIVKAAKKLPPKPTPEQIAAAVATVTAPKPKANKTTGTSLRDRVLDALNAMLRKFKDSEKEQVKAIILEQLQ